MTVQTMAKDKSEKKIPAPPAEPVADESVPASPKEASLKVDLEDGQLVVKVATMRGLSVKNLFRSPDVKEFFRHLLLEEMRKETERLQTKKKS